MKGDYQKPLKKLTLFFLSNPVPFNGQSYKSQKGLGTKIHKFKNSKVHKNFFISYILSDQVWCCNIKQFLSYSKNYTCEFMQTNSWHHNNSISICSFESGKCGKEAEKIQYLENKKSFLDQIKNIFHSFWREGYEWKTLIFLRSTEKSDF